MWTIRAPSRVTQLFLTDSQANGLSTSFSALQEAVALKALVNIGPVYVPRLS